MGQSMQSQSKSIELSLSSQLNYDVETTRVLQPSRRLFSVAELNTRSTETFNKLFELDRFDQHKIKSLAELLAFSTSIGQRAQKMYYALERLLEFHGIMVAQIDPRDTWIFALYQTLRQLEYKEYDKAHVYTSLVGKTYANKVIAKLNSHVPDWIDEKGKIKEPTPH